MRPCDYIRKARNTEDKNSDDTARQNVARRKSSHLEYWQKKWVCETYFGNTYSSTPVMTPARVGVLAQEKSNLSAPLSQSAISKAIAKRNDFLRKTPEQMIMRNDRRPNYPGLEEKLADFVAEMAARNQPVSGDSIIAQAKIIANEMDIQEAPKFSIGWLQGFKRRHGYRGYVTHGESGSAGLSQTEVITNIAELRELLDNYEERDIYNFDETGLFYAQVPTRTISKEPIKGLKNSKNRITIGVLCNADGSEKPELVIIGKHERPACFKKKRAHEYDFHYYYYNKKAWMMKDIFVPYFEHLNDKMERRNRKIVVIMDNAACHDKTLQLSNITFVYLPPNSTALLQPLDAGIIANLKAQYKYMKAANRYHLWKAKYNKDPSEYQSFYETNQLEAMCNIRLAWRRVTPDTIRNCFVHTGLVGDPIHIDLMAVDTVDMASDEAIGYINEIHPDINENSILITEDEREDDFVRNNEITDQTVVEEDACEPEDEMSEEAIKLKKKVFKNACQDFLETVEVITESDDRLYSEVYKRLRDLILEETRDYKQSKLRTYFKRQ